MKIALINSCAGESCATLAKALKEEGHDVYVGKPYKDDKVRFSDRVVFSYGCSAQTLHEKRFNKRDAVLNCVDKVSTFIQLNRAGVPTVEYTTDWDKIPKHWDQVVCRDKVDGRKAEGIEYYFQGEVPKGKALYTQVFYGNYEYRIIILCGKLVGIYYKREIDGEWLFMLQNPKGFEGMVEHAIKAAKALNIDYVGFDVLAKNKRSYVFLEANSGPSLTGEAEAAILSLFNTLQ